MKLYRYRPVSLFLFKELKYREIYLATYGELNDPQDLSCSINFYSTDKNKVSGLAYFLYRNLIHAHGIRKFAEIHKMFSYEVLGDFLIDKFKEFEGEEINEKQLEYFVGEFYSEYIQGKTSSSLDEEPKAQDLFDQIKKVTNQFLRNSSVACFSETYNNFLMWSHYAGGHDGICLEFETERADTEEKSGSKCKLISTVNFLYKGKPVEYWTDLDKVNYQESMPSIDFYEFFHAFINEGDTDLMHLSKSRWHPYADYLKTVFTQKLQPWAEEREWRIVRVEFKPSMPEDRILKYTDNSLKSVYFGANVDVYTQLRIANIVGSSVSYYKCGLNGTRTLDVDEVHIDMLQDSYVWG